MIEKRVTPENVAGMRDNEIFVFGSNLKGVHGGGAARVAREKFGARTGVGEGLTGRCYAFPTVTVPEHVEGRQLTPQALIEARDRFFAVTRDRAGLVFLLTRVGCGLAGFPEDQMARLFRGAPENVVTPRGWRGALSGASSERDDRLVWQLHALDAPTGWWRHVGAEFFTEDDALTAAHAHAAEHTGDSEVLEYRVTRHVTNAMVTCRVLPGDARELYSAV